MGSLIFFPAKCLIFIVYAITHFNTLYKCLFSYENEEEEAYYQQMVQDDLEFYFYYYQIGVTIFLLFCLLVYIYN